MKQSVVLVLAALIFSGCKMDSPKSDTADQGGGGVGPIVVPQERMYTASELKIGRRICSALKSKRELFETLTDMQEQFRVRTELTNCMSPNPYSNQEFNVSISNASSTDFEYIASGSRKDYFKDVVTDQNGAMRILCDNLSKSDAVSNTMLSGSSYLIVNLLIADGYDRFEVSKRSKDSAGNYNIVSSEGVAVITQTSQAATKFFGVEKDRIRYSPCPGSKSVSYVKQTWVNAVTPF